MVERFTLYNRVDNIVLLTPDVQIELIPGDINIWEDLSAQPYEVFEDVDVASGALKMGLGGIENPTNSPHITDEAMSEDPRFAVDFSSNRGGMEINGPKIIFCSLST